MSSSTPNLQEAGVDAWLVEAVDALARGRPDVFDGLLVAVGDPMLIDATLATCRCNLVVRDANGSIRVDALARTLAAQVIDYCIPRSRIKEAHETFERTGSTDAFVRLQGEARELFTKLVKSGEGGELLLYLLLERVLGLPQLLCKMPLKTSTQMHYHGTDGIHGRVLENGNLALYWGESKLYASVNDAIDACLESIAPFLTDETGDVRRRDILLLRDNIDLGDGEMTAALHRFLVEDSPESARVEFRGACLVGFDLAEYPNPTDEAATQQLTAPWTERLASAIEANKLASFEMEVFCLPFPSVDDFRSTVRKRLGIG